MSDNSVSVRPLFANSAGPVEAWFSYGAGSLATEQKGKIWLNAAIQEKVAQIHEILEQQRRREERRSSGYGLWGESLDEVLSKYT